VRGDRAEASSVRKDGEAGVFLGDSPSATKGSFALRRVAKFTREVVGRRTSRGTRVRQIRFNFRRVLHNQRM
jgi:hypothetical protein